MPKYPAIMGIINLTPDSFSDGGKLTTPKKILAQAQKLITQGATILDLGAESSGPNSVNVSLTEELNRLQPALNIFQTNKIFDQVKVSIDTYKAEVADFALKAGAHIINDITGLRGSPNMAAVIAKHQAKVIIMYSKDPTARTTKTETIYKDIIQTITTFLKQQTDYAINQGIKSENIIIDPGMGAFLSTIPKYSFEVLKRLAELKQLGYPILVGTSRKSFLGGKIQDRDLPSLIADTIALYNGADIIRTHNPEKHLAVITTLNEIIRN